MSPLCAHHLAELRRNFDGVVDVVRDDGDRLLVRITPDPKPDDDVAGDWGRVVSPTVLLLDPALIREDAH